MIRCENHWRGKHDWRGPGGRRPPPGGPYSGITAGCLTSLACCRCGTSYASATADERPNARTFEDIVREAERASSDLDLSAAADPKKETA